MTSPYRFDFSIGPIEYGPNCVAGLEDEFRNLGVERPMLVCGRTVGSTPEVVDPVIAGAGDSFVDVFDETTPDKKLATVFEGVRRMRSNDVDALVSLGGGSSLDVAKGMSIVAAMDREFQDIRDEFERTKSLTLPDGNFVPLVVIPTTLAGSDLSSAVGLTSRQGGFTRGIISDARLWPSAEYYDPELFKTTPQDILCASVMNGFDKAVETPYSQYATPITDGTAVRALRLFQSGLPKLGAGERDEETLFDVINGSVLAAYGGLRPTGRTSSVIHAFCHPISREYAIQQGAAHGIIAPHALRYLFEKSYARRDLLAEGFGILTDDPDAQAEGIIDAVTNVRDELGLPTRLRSIEDLPKEDLPAVARDVYEDHTLYQGPEDFEPTVEELEQVLREAW